MREIVSKSGDANAGPPIPVGSRPVALAYDGLRLWVANSDDGTVQYILVYKRANK